MPGGVTVTPCEVGFDWECHLGYFDDENDAIAKRKEGEREMECGEDPTPLAKTRKVAANQSGTRGVTWDAGKGKWAATISYNRSRVYLGYFDDEDKAIAARKKGERMMECGEDPRPPQKQKRKANSGGGSGSGSATPGKPSAKRKRS